MSSSVLSQRLRPRSLPELLQSLQMPPGTPCLVIGGRQQVRAYCTIVDATIMTIIIITIIIILVTVHSHDHRRGSIIIPLNTPVWLCLQGRRATMGCTNALGADVRVEIPVLTNRYDRHGVVCVLIRISICISSIQMSIYAYTYI